MRNNKLIRSSISSVLILVLMTMMLTVSSEPVSAASKKKAVAYTDVYIDGSTAFCNGDGIFCRVDLNSGAVSYYSKSNYSYFTDFQKKGKYLYCIMQTSGALNYLKRINLKTGKMKTLSKNVFDYKVTKKKIYYSHCYFKNNKEVNQNLKMKLNGKRKQKTKVKVKMKRLESNVNGCGIYKNEVETFDGYYVDNYLITPGRNYYLGRSVY